ncbi:MAG TPA: rhodanese-like domain-containing protein [Terrimicrobiaceae bacterium]
MNRGLRSQSRADVVGCGLIATAALCAGLVINQFRDSPMPLIYQNKSERLSDAVAKIAPTVSPEASPPRAESVSLPPRLSLEEFRNFVEGKQGWVLDARPELFHRLGHVPGAIAMPRDDFENYYRKHQGELEKDKGRVLVIYCSGGDCEDSELVETALRKLEYTQISIFEGGWGEWTKAGLPEETNL